MNRTLLLVVCLGAVVAAPAQEQTPGLRRRLEEKGLSAGAAYATEAFIDGASGAALGNFTAHLELDLQRLHFSRGQVFASVQGLHGSGVNSRLIGAVQSPSNLEDDPFRKWGEAWYADTYAGGKARVRAGRQYADRDFGVVDTAADFLNAAFGALPTAPMPTYPNPQLGVATWVAPSSALSVGAGAYQGGFAVVETRARLFSRDTAALGAWKQGGQPGIYVTAEHRFSPEADTSRAVFARWSRASGSSQAVSSYAAAGFVYAKAGLGVTTVHSAGQRREVVYEVFYKQGIRGRVSVQPDAQYVVNPAGDTCRHSGRRWVAGIRMTVEL